MKNKCNFQVLQIEIHFNKLLKMNYQTRNTVVDIQRFQKLNAVLRKIYC